MSQASCAPVIMELTELVCCLQTEVYPRGESSKALKLESQWCVLIWALRAENSELPGQRQMDAGSGQKQFKPDMVGLVTHRKGDRTIRK